MKCNLYKKLSF